MKTVTFILAIAMSLSAFAEPDYPPVTRNIEVQTPVSIIHFPFDQSVPEFTDMPIFKQTVLDVVDLLSKHPGAKVRIEGHADETGTEPYNYELSKRRIYALAAELEKYCNCEDLVRIVMVPYGEVNPLEDGHSDKAWAANRRIAVSIIH